MPTCHVLRIPRIGYLDALQLQQRILERVRQAQAQDAALLLLEHEPVITIGRRGGRDHLRVSTEELARRGIGLHETNRGGDVTYHGPGQLVGYPIVYLPEGKRDVHRFLRSIESVLIATLARFGIAGCRVPGYTGVWVGGAKVAAIGIAFSRWTSHHGFALNLDPDLTAFELIVPCGIADRPVTSMARVLGHAPDHHQVEDALIEQFMAEFALDAAVEHASPDRLLDTFQASWYP
ncbi:MAG: lipoyl(octanoyl) transferase LipB [Planctomycetes bacterium]|nr:lipoyl(octanoyl) transferase LipB [Planctomycetota bacterium]